MDGFDRFIMGICVLAVVLVLLIIGSCSVAKIGGVYADYSDGSRSGLLQKWSTSKGLFFKSGEGEMLLGGLTSSGSRSNQTSNVQPVLWDFSCRDPQINAKLDALVGHYVVVKYRQWLLAPWAQSEDYTAIDVTEAK